MSQEAQSAWDTAFNRHLTAIEDARTSRVKGIPKDYAKVNAAIEYDKAVTNFKAWVIANPFPSGII